MRISPAVALRGGAGRDRTGDLLNANQALSQLSYSPKNQSRPVGCRSHETSPRLVGKTVDPQVEIRNVLIRRPEGRRTVLEWNGCLLLAGAVH